MAEWPPTLTGLKDDLDLNTTEHDVSLQLELDAAVEYVMRRRSDLNYNSDPLDNNPPPGSQELLGTYRLAGRWFTRKRSPDGIIQAGDAGTTRVPLVDADIARLLGIDRYSKPVFA